MQEIVNGVDRQAIFATIDAIKADPGLASFEFRIRNEWLGGGLNRSTVSDFHGTRQDIDHAEPFVLYNDEPPVLLSGDKGPNPVENLLHALAGCLTTSVVYHAAARGMQVDAVRTRFEGDLDLRGFLGIADVPAGYAAVRMVVTLEGPETGDRYRELADAVDRHCPVYDVLARPVAVERELRIA